MNELPENEKMTGDAPEEDAEQLRPVDEYDSYETIFGDPESHGDKAPKKKGKRRILSVITAALSVAVLVAGTITVIKLIPEKEDESPESLFTDITVLDFSASDFDSVTVTNSNGSFRFLADKVTGEDGTSSDSTSSATTTVTWYVEGIDQAMVNSSKISGIVSSAASITASREITTKTTAECGLDTPIYTADVVSESLGDYSVLVGSDSPDGLGVYLKLSTSDKIYIVDSYDVSGFEFELLDLADTTAIPGVATDSSMSDYLGDDDALVSFDSITVTGANFSSPLVIEMNDDEDVGAFLAYKITAPTVRVADNVDNLFTMFRDGLSVTGAYAFDVSPASLAAVGLDQPYLTAVIKVGSYEKTFRISKVDDTSCAVITDDSIMIKKVDASSISFLDYTTESFYGSWVCMRSINTLSNFTVEAEGETYSFDIVYDDSDDAEETYVISCNGTKMTAQYFQNFYQYFVGLSTADFITGELSAAPDMKITLTYSADGAKEVLTFTKSNETKYQYALDGKPMGRITSSAYNKLLGYVKDVAAGKDVTP